MKDTVFFQKGCKLILINLAVIVFVLLLEFLGQLLDDGLCRLRIKHPLALDDDFANIKELVFVQAATAVFVNLVEQLRGTPYKKECTGKQQKQGMQYQIPLARL